MWATPKYVVEYNLNPTASTSEALRLQAHVHHAVFFLILSYIIFVYDAVEQIHSFLRVMQALYQLRHNMSTKHVETGFYLDLDLPWEKKAKNKLFLCINPITKESN